ncbi:MAG: hypothetical protein WCK98_07600 [bacterium]
MFPFSKFIKLFDNKSSELLLVSFSKLSIQLVFDNSLHVYLNADLYYLNSKTTPIKLAQPDKVIPENLNIFYNLIGAKLLKIKEFDKSDESPSGYLVFYFENKTKLKINFEKSYESVTLDFRDNEDKTFVVF